MTDIHSFQFPREPSSVPDARAALGRFDGRLSASTLYDASLCLSELVTNAIQHPVADSGEEVGLKIQLTDALLRVEVVDPGSDFEPGTPTEGDERGWGLFIVNQLSSSWGAERGAGRTTIWFEIARDDTARRRDAADAGSSDPGDQAGDRRDEIANAVARLRLRPAIQ